MKRVIYRLLAIRAASVSLGIGILVTLLLASCHNMDKWDEVPQDINDFVTQYYPGVAYSSFSETGSGYSLRLRNGPAITFNSNCDWTSINGYGMPVPQVFLFDRMPPALYQYLEENTVLNDVFYVSRDAKEYVLETSQDKIVYTIETGDITQTPLPPLTPLKK